MFDEGVDDGGQKLFCNVLVDEKTHREKRKADLQEALDSLEELCREIITCRFFESMTFEETARVLDMSVDQVRYRLQKCLGNLRDMLSSD